jgi:hypothetical protein
MHHPGPPRPANETFALYGTSVDKTLIIASLATSGFIVGGSLIDRRTLVEGLTALPAIAIGGRPSAPVTERLALH